MARNSKLAASKSKEKAMNSQKAEAVKAEAAATGVAKKGWSNPITDAFQFLSDVRAEARKVTWTSRRETIATTIMVLIMVTLAAIFFYLVDTVVGTLIGALLNLAK